MGDQISMVVAAEAATRARSWADAAARCDAVVGEPTGSAPNFVGEMTPFFLPESRVRVNVSDLWWQTSWPFDSRVAVAPQLYARPTMADYLAGRDVAMDAARAHVAL